MPITITIGEDGESLNGEMHLSSLRNYTARLIVFTTPLSRYAALPLTSFTALEQEHCSRVARSVGILLAAVGTVTALSVEVLLSMTREQSAQLRVLRTELEERHAAVVVLLGKVRTVLEGLAEEGDES